MKGFTREHTEFSLCGLACLLCPMQVGGYCPGCGGGSGNQSCAIARCSLEQGGPEFCSGCAAYPCARYDEFDAADSFVPHSRRAADLARAGEMGLDAWLAECGKSAPFWTSCWRTGTTAAESLSTARPPICWSRRLCAG